MPGSKHHWSAGLDWSGYLRLWSWALNQDNAVGIVGLLCLLCSPLAWGLFLYHVYLVWAGTTTNESAKWSDWKDDIADGVVFKARRREARRGDPSTPWPVSSDQVLAVFESGSPPRPGETAAGSRELVWSQVFSLREVDNIYDLGLWGNVRDIFSGRRS